MRIDAEVLREVAERAAQLVRRFCDVASVEADRSASGPRYRGEHAHERRFSRTVGAEQPKNPGLEPQREITDGVDRAIAFVQSIDKEFHRRIYTRRRRIVSGGGEGRSKSYPGLQSARRARYGPPHFLVDDPLLPTGDSQMIPRLIRWTAPATLTSAMLALTACAGGNWSTVPSAQGSSQIASVGAKSVNQAHIAILNAQPNVTCPKRYLDCDTVSQKHGALLIWCYGPSSDPCSDSDAGEVTWSGVVCLAKGAACKKPIKQLTAAWSGPFK